MIFMTRYARDSTRRRPRCVEGCQELFVASLCQALEPLESVVDEHPVFVVLATGTRCCRRSRHAAVLIFWSAWNLQIHVRELIEIRSVIDTLHL